MDNSYILAFDAGTSSSRAIVFDRERRAMVALGAPAALRDGSDDPFVRAFFTRGGSNG